MTRHSVIIPVFNGQRYLGDAIASALVQLAADDEVLVVDNGSTDGTRDVVSAHPDARVRLLVLPTPSVSAARNLGVRESRGDFISFLDHDDLWPDGRHAGLLGAIRGTPGANAAHGRMRMLFEPESEADIAHYQHLDGLHVALSSAVVYMFARSLVERVGPFDETLAFGEDSDFVQRAVQSGMAAASYDGEALIYRRHAGNSTRDRNAMKRAAMDVLHRNIGRLRRQWGGP